MMSDDARLIDLETRLSYCDATLQQLNDVVIAQQQRIAKLERICAQLGDRVARMGQDLYKDGPADEVPPHY